MYILYRAATSTTGRNLRRILGCNGGYPSHLARREVDSLVRWGVSTHANHRDCDGLNSYEAVALAADKYESLRVMQEKGVSVIPFARTLDGIAEEGVWLGRRRYHTGGTDIQVLETPRLTAGVPGCDFFTKYVKSVGEMRIHVFRGEMILAQLKKYRGEDEEQQVKIRNHDEGYEFVPFVHTKPNRTRVDTAAKAVSALSLDFGAVDLLTLPDGGQTVLEVNTAPGATPRTLRAYTEAIVKWAGERGEVLTPRWDRLEEMENDV